MTAKNDSDSPPQGTIEPKLAGPHLASRSTTLEFERLLDSGEAAALLKIHPKTLQRMARNHEIAGVQIGKLWRFRASVLNQWLEEKLAG
jgi:excisionase family DNA binding protein